MKNVIVLACLSMLPLSYAAAEGYQANAQSTKQSGMGHVGAAMKLGAESMHFNPAGLAFMNKTIDLSVGVSGAFTHAEFTAKDGYSLKSDNDPGTPMYVYAGFKVYDFLVAGISLNTPYGSTINWGKDWKGAHLVQDISLKAFNIQPTLAWKIMDNLSIGAGLMMEFGNISMNRALIGPGAMTGMAKGMVDQLIATHPELAPMIPGMLGPLQQQMAKYDDASAASVLLKGDAGIRLGFNVGAMYDVNEKITVGVSYRSKVMARVKDGEIGMEYANKTDLDNILEKVKGLIGQMEAMGIKSPISADRLAVPPLEQGTFSAELPMPDNWNVGVTYKPTNSWILSGEVQFVGWSAYKSLDVKFSPSSLSPYNLSAAKNYHNTRIYRLGAQFGATSRMDVRLGAYYDESPVKDNYLNPETPSMNKLGLTAGLSFRPITDLSVDFAFSYVTGFGRDGSYTDKDMFTGADRTFGGHYNVYAFNPSIGISYAF